MPIPKSILEILQQNHPSVLLRWLKIQKTADSNIIPNLSFTTYNTFPHRQYFDRNDFGSLVYTTHPDEQILRIHLLVPYYPVREGDAQLDWITKKLAVANHAIASIPGLTSLYTPIYHGDLMHLLPSILTPRLYPPRLETPHPPRRAILPPKRPLLPHRRTTHLLIPNPPVPDPH